MRENRFAKGNANPPGPARDSFAAEAEAAFREFVLRPEFPCLGAKAALNSGSYTLGVYGELGSEKVTSELSAALYDFTKSTLRNDPHPSLLPQGEGIDLSPRNVAHLRHAGKTIPPVGVYAELGNDNATHELSAELCVLTRSTLHSDPHPDLLPQGAGTALSEENVEFETRATTEIPLPEGEGRVRVPSEYATFVAIFERPQQLDEIEFENLLWQQLRALHQHDAAHFDWDPNVRSDPADPHFSFSLGGQALYVIGLHANSSREARRFPWPALVFNPHEQFERLRADGKWKRMQETIRSRDLELQGTINPMLSDFGMQSEARQYSGRAVEDNWQAPFPKIAGQCPFAH